MRARRLLERKPSGKYLVDQAVTEQYKQGGEQREQLEMALSVCRNTAWPVQPTNVSRWGYVGA